LVFAIIIKYIELTLMYYYQLQRKLW